MPPKKDKKKKPKAKKAKKMRLMVQEPLPQFATGYSRPIPGGIIGTGGAIGMPPASFLSSGYASRQLPPATPIQTPDQFQIQRQIASQGQAIESIVEEQKAVRRGRRTDASIAEDEGITIEAVRARRAQQRMPTEMPMSSTPMRQQVQTPTANVSMADASASSMVDDEVMIIPAPNVRKIRVKKEKTTQSMMMPPPPTAPPIIGYGATFPGGSAMREQGLMMGVPGRLAGLPPDASQSLVGIQGIGDSDVFYEGGGGVLRPQGSLGEGGM